MNREAENRHNHIEILAPAGSYESLTAALAAGADAIYAGGMRFGARAYAGNLDEEQYLRAIDEVHLQQRKIYMTVNTLLKDYELAELYEYLLPYYRQGLDAVIVQDLGVFSFIREVFPDLPVHVSTQMTVTGEYGAEFFGRKGATRIVPAREISLEEVRRMKERTGLEMECFVHGAMCYCYSGQCLMSSMIGGRSGNRGQCAQPCRLPYSVEGKKPQDLMSLKDLCTIEMIPDLIEAGIDSFKIEGRMKQPEYVYTVVRMYRKYVNLYLQKGRDGFRVKPEDLKTLENAYRRRGYMKGYYQCENGRSMLSLKRPKGEEQVETLPEFSKKQEKIKGVFTLSEGSRAKIDLCCREASVSCEGAEVQKALKQPLDEKRIDKQMRKTGQTPFTFDELEIHTEGSIFLPMQAINELRRESLGLLGEKLLEPYRRTSESSECVETFFERQDEICSEYNNVPADERFTVRVCTPEQFEAAAGREDVAVILAESTLCEAKEWKNLREKLSDDQKLYLAMPYIFRKRAVKLFEQYYAELKKSFDGVMIRNFESLAWLKEKNYTDEILTDYNMYVFNHSGKAFLKQEGISRFTASVELNGRELKDCGLLGGMLSIYGYQPVMITANCIQKNTRSCERKPSLLYLTDRYQNRFPVRNECSFCYNIIYNPVPLMLMKQHKEIRNLQPSALRLDFTMESGKETRDIINVYGDVFLRGRNAQLPEASYTKGHFKRGVK